jgi:hypothetical protein
MPHVHVFVASALLGLAVSQVPGNTQSAAAQAPGIRALAVQYADGRITNSVIRATGGGRWTTLFPRVAGAETSKDGLPLSALQFEEAVDGSKLVVTIALLYGSPHQARVKVATVPLTDDQPVRVAELEAFGVKPIVMSIVTLPAPNLVLPSITTPSSQLDVIVETAGGDVPAYRMVATNRGPQPVMSFSFKAYRGNTISLSGSPHRPGNVPLIMPGETRAETFQVAANVNRGTDQNAWLPIDRIVITSVTWGDGMVEGDPEPASRARAVAAGSAQQLARIVELFRAAAHAPQSHSLSQLRADVAALPIAVSAQEAADALAGMPEPRVLSADSIRSSMQLGMQNAKNAALNDIDEAAPRARPEVYAGWLTAMVAKFGDWGARIVAR